MTGDRLIAGRDCMSKRTGAQSGRAAVALLVALGLLAAVAAGLVFGVRALLAQPGDYPGPGSGEVTVEIEPGDSLSAMGETLAAADVVASREAFVTAAEAEPAALSIGPGRYSMRLQMSGAGAVQRLLDPSARVQFRVALPEGLRLPESIEIMARETGLPAAQFEEALADPALQLPPYAGGNPEGYVFPATYTFETDATAAQVVEATVARFDQAATTVDLVDGAAALGLFPDEVVTIASIIQAEVRPEDFTKAARVIYNRLEQGMPLQMDSTVNFALNRSRLAVSLEDLKVDSPYNTYANKGLPPGPINSPGEEALAAALAPADGDWLYFVSVDPGAGVTKFTADYDEFLRFKAEFQASQQ